MEISTHKAAELLKLMTGELRQDEYGETAFMLDDGRALLLTTSVHIGVHTSSARVVYHHVMGYIAEEFEPLPKAPNVEVSRNQQRPQNDE